MCEQDNHEVESDTDARDAYDEFDERMRRIGRGLIVIWRDLSPSERLGNIVSFVTLVALIFYTGYTIKIYKASNRSANAANQTLGEIQKQTTLMRQQVVGSQGAVLRLDIHAADTATRAVVGGIANMGIVTATHIRTHVEVRRQTIRPDGIIETIGNPLIYDEGPEQLKGSSSWPEGPNSPHEWRVPWIRIVVSNESLAAWPKDWPGKEITEVKGHLTYENGFGETGETGLCLSVLPNFIIKIRNNGTMLIGGAYPCGNLRDWIADARERWEKVKQ
jgi:hypothetical protein